MKITEASISWEVTSDKSRSYGFVQGKLCFVIRPPRASSAEKNKEPMDKPYVLHDIVHNMIYTTDSRPPAMDRAFTILTEEMFGKEVDAKLWNIEVPLNQLDDGYKSKEIK